MRIRLILAVLSLGLAASPACGQTAPAEPQFSPDAVRAHVDFLSDDLLEGRNAGTRGYDIAARYVATRFEALGLKPAGTDGGWYQQVRIATSTLDPAHPGGVTIGGKRFANGADVAMAPTPRFGSAPQIVTAGVVFAGYGLDAPEAGIDDYAGLDVAGKIVVVLNGAPPGVPSALADAQDKTANAARRGAAGIFYLVAPAELERNPWSRTVHYVTRGQTAWLGAGDLPNGYDPGVKIGGYLAPAAAEALFEGAPMSAAQVFAKARSKDRPKGFALARTLTAERTSLVTLIDTPNVIGLLPGADPALASEYVVLSAHLDHEGVDPNRPGPDRIYNGAMDNAAGVATMLEAARAFVESGKRPRRSILFVALTSEEDGLLGSDYLAHHPVTGSGRVVADVNLDMPILLYDFTDVVAFGAEHSTMGAIVERAGARMGVTVSPDPMPEENLFVRSDHYSFVKTGVPSVFLVTGFANGGEKAFRDFLANHYHQVSDQVTPAFNWAAGAKFARLNYLIAREIADGDEAPRWYEGDPFGERFAPGQPRAKKP